MAELNGTVERITFYNEENCYTVAKLKMNSGRLATVIGDLPPLYIGEILSLQGQWIKHKEYGEQFQIEEWTSEIPKTLLGIERFLSSGLLKGVGPVTAKKIARKFGLKSLEIIAQEPDKLTQIPGISQDKAGRISRSLQDHSEIQRIMVFLQGVGVSAGYALKIYRKYQNQAIQVVKENPYRLADEVIGIGFKIADQIAQKIGIQSDSPYRIQAGIRYLLNENSTNGHVYTKENEFLAKAAVDLGIIELQLTAEVEELVLRKEIFRDQVDDETILYLAPFYYSEVGAAQRIRDLLQTRLPQLGIKPEQVLHEYELNNQIQLADKQKTAVLQAVNAGMIVITGGPGTGKTTIIKAILNMFQAADLQVLLAAPTGRATKRLAEATGADAKTIHRMLGYGNQSGGSRFQHDEDEPLEADALIIDEFSMVDLVLFYNLLKAILPGTRLVIVGDVDQLPSVGPGSVLRDLIDSGCIPTVRLEVIFRQAGKSMIVSNAHKINYGEFPDLSSNQDFFFVEQSDPEQIVRDLPALVKQRIPDYLHCDPIEDIQILTPMRRTITGVENLNVCVQEALNPADPNKPELKTGSTIFRVGDKVMQLRNDYQKLVFNGDIGRIRLVDPEERRLVIGYPEVDGERSVTYEPEELDQLVLSYAISVHKSQGNEYPVVVMPVTTQHYLMLQRNLLYTAVTRAKKMVLIIGTKKAIFLAIKNNRIEERNSLLEQRIQRALN